MLKATGIDTFICAIRQIFSRVDFDAFGFFCDVQAGLEVIEFCTKDQQINKIVFDIVQKMKPTHLKIYRRKNYLIYASMQKLGRNNYYVVGVIDKNYPIIYSIEEPFATLALLLSLIFHLNISLSEDSKTLQRVHDLFRRIGVFGLFEFYGSTGESCDILSHQSKWSIKMTDDLVNCIKKTPYNTDELHIYKMPNNQWIGIISRVERDYIKSHYVRTILVEDLTRMKKVCDKETDIHSDELLLQQMLNIHVFHKGSNYMDESLAQELGYSRPIDSIFDIIYPEDAGFFSKYIRTPNWITFRLKSSTGEYMWYCSYHNCLFCIHEDLQQPTAEFAIDLDQTLMAAAGNYINLYSIDVKTDEILTAFAPQRFVPHIGREFVEYYEESFKSKFELNYAKIKSGEQTSLHFLALVITTDEKTYRWYDTIMERHQNDTIASPSFFAITRKDSKTNSLMQKVSLIWHFSIQMLFIGNLRTMMSKNLFLHHVLLLTSPYT
ncbi:hypothetical protein TVAG_005570 [Trichomonas vaginalis G3]|uniref:Uncharacterized protein n=1 Tax=Trichomonas vaginalis (strain ATCC PRA-98 / G3) TaxID=412133 RepID=A2ENT7_TRIV3|nr:hypothetical protein TVAGG3_0666880 [Trichomonas vaginalis G3]EAY05713.1 hypothetical protein TVAG_005570 [Trichomonas vaginalis G3]KAI5506893.1 hypothetical protein TVAGG3_0666880 [Trichomonas vaginalis G3]|eukprot:XP_001317936.1 hypothetical protein [Trichomonas vaginalis G3]